MRCDDVAVAQAASASPISAMTPNVASVLVIEAIPPITGPRIAPRIGMSRSVYAAADHKTARAHMDEGVAQWMRGMQKRGALPANLTLDEAYALIKRCRPIVKDRRSWLGNYNR